MIRPKHHQPHLPEAARWRNVYVGVPEHVIVKLSETDMPEGVAAIPVVRPDNVVVDRGHIFMLQAFQDACARIGTSIQPARPRTGTDKTYLERMFGTIGTMFLRHVPAYKGPDVWSRGTAKEVEEKAFCFIDKLEAYFDDWTASFWQVRPHGGLFSSDAPGVHFSPNELYEEGIVRAGFVYVPRDANLYYELLPSKWRRVTDEGVGFAGLRYDGDVFNAYREQTSSYPGEHQGKWPVRYDTHDLSQFFFYDLEGKCWVPIHRVHSRDPDRPFNDATLGFVKSLILARQGRKVSQGEVSALLDAVLDRIEADVLSKRGERRLATRQLEEARQALRDRAGPSPHVSMKGPDGLAEVMDVDMDPPTSSKRQHGKTTTSAEIGLLYEKASEDDEETVSPTLWEDA